ncbi:hypothetical protein HaLaN_32807, partial [Haematococcus lacustris]
MAPLMPCQADLPGTSLTTPSASLEGCTSTSMAPNLPGRGGIADGRRQVCCEPRNGPARTMFRCQNIDAARSSTRCSEPRRMHRAKKFTHLRLCEGRDRYLGSELYLTLGPVSFSRPHRQHSNARLEL